MQFSTTPTLEGQPIIEYCGVVTGEAILGANVFRDFFASIRDIVGGEDPPMKRCRAGVLLALLLAGCASEKGIIDRDGYQLDTRHPAQAAYPRIKVLVIHYTADDFDVSLATLTDNQVSSHYLIPEKPPLHGMRGSASGAAARALTIPRLALSWRIAAGKKRRG